MSDSPSGDEGTTARLRRRYLDTVKASLCNEHHLEHELRIEHLRRAIDRSIAVDPDLLRDPGRFGGDSMRTRAAARRAGQFDPDDPVEAQYPYTTVGHAGLDDLEAVLEDLRAREITGDLIDLGTGRGGAAIFLRASLDAVGDRSARVHVIDAFRPASGGAADFGADLDTVRDAFHRFDLLDAQIVFHQGPASEAFDTLAIGGVALLRIGRTASASDIDAFAGRPDLVRAGGVIMVEDTAGPGVADAVDRLRAATGGTAPIERRGFRGGAWIVGRSDLGRPSARLAEAQELDLTVVVVVYNMRDQAVRTLLSLTPTYQLGVAGVDYEVIVVENGSDPEQALGEDTVRSFGRKFRYIDMGSDANPSPVAALNRGIAAGRGESFALMIDGAHLLSPGVLAQGLRGLREAPPSITAIRHWYLGPGQQDRTTGAGYDADYEAELLESIDWPRDGYALFGIGQFIGDKDWIDQSYESNCLFVPRSLLERYGCFDPAFAMPGGGYANLDLFERLEAAPDVTTVSVIGEATFHQLHGGVTTNASDLELATRRLQSYEDHYRQLRGRPFHVDGRRVAFIGTLTSQANRSRGRRVTPARFFRRRADDPDGLPRDPSLVPEDLERDFTEAFWRSLAWQSTTWLGTTVARAPTDLQSYQELLSELRPDAVVVACEANDGLPAFLASICGLLGHGHVVAVRYPSQRPPGSAVDGAIDEVVGRPEHPEVSDRLHALVGSAERALVVVAGRLGRPGVVQAVRALAPLVPVGSFMVVENTAVNGHPIWRNYGPGPGEAVRQILTESDEFVRDGRFDRFAMTFNPGGCLRKVR